MEIRIEQLSKTYSGQITALAEINLTIGVGMFGLLGPNGAGKTTLLRILCTLLEPTSGRIWFGELDRLRAPQRVRELIGYLPQEFGFFKRLTGAEYLDFAGSMKGLSTAERRRQIPLLLEQVHLADQRKQQVGSYSGGMKRRLGIAQALLGEPKVLVVDEPTSGLDPEERLHLRNLLAAMSVERIVLLSTHIVADVESTCSRLAVLDKGRLKFAGAPGELVRAAEGQVWQLDVTPEEFARVQNRLKIVSSRRTADGVSLRVIAESNPLGRATPAPATLEDGYLCLMGGNGAAQVVEVSA